MYPQQPARQVRKKKTNRTLLIVLSSVLGVLVLCVGVTVIYGLTSGDKPAAPASAAANAGIPPTPNAEVRAAYLTALNGIDPDIVHGKDDQAVSRGRDQCSSVKESSNDQAKLVDLTNKRFTSPTHPDGFGAATAEQILVAVRKHICPTY